MKATVEFDVTGCHDCLLSVSDSYDYLHICSHPDVGIEDNGKFVNEKTFPGWCPLAKKQQPKLKIDQFAYLFEANDKLECVAFDNIDISNTQPNKNRVKLHCDMEVSKDVFNGLIELQRRKTKNEI